MPNHLATTPTKPYKAAAAFVVTFLAALLAQVQDKTEFSDLTALQWVVTIAGALVSAAVVFSVPNPPQD